MTRLPDGGLQWTTPGGQTITTHPLRYGTDDDLPPPEQQAHGSASMPVQPQFTAAERILGTSLPRGVVDEDPPPF